MVQEKEVILSEANLETLVAGQTSNESMEGVDKLLGSSCTLLYLRYGISMNERDGNHSRQSTSRSKDESGEAMVLLNKLLSPQGADKVGSDSR